MPGARTALALLLGINLFNYIDRYILAAVERHISADFFRPDDPTSKAKMGSLVLFFTITYMVAAPLFGWLADRMSRWVLIGVAVLLWTLASGGSGLATTFTMLLVTRVFIGIGEAGYGPAAPTLISDMYPVSRRGWVLAWFYMAIPLGSALGFAIGGGLANHFHNWRLPFYAVVPPGLLLGAACFFMREPPRGKSEAAQGAMTQRRATLADYLVLAKTPSYVLNTLGMTAMTFAIGGISFWMPRYVAEYRKAAPLFGLDTDLTFGAIVAVSGIVATLAGGVAGDLLRKRFPGSYFLVSGAAILVSCPLVLVMLHTPFPAAWGVMFLVVFFLFFNTGPTNTILANVTHPSVRATGFAVNILVIHLLGDALSPTLLGAIVGPKERWNAAFVLVAMVMAVAGVLWLWGARYLQRDTDLAPTRLAG